MSGAEALDCTLAALAEPCRRQAIDLLRERPYAAGELARALGLAPPAMSRHLKTLREAGLVAESHPQFDARVRVYSLQTGPLVELMRWMEAAEQLWGDQLAGLKAHLEGAP